MSNEIAGWSLFVILLISISAPFISWFIQDEREYRRREEDRKQQEITVQLFKEAIERRNGS